jgi:D-inositol-3-phosphate glycosyltransferase
LHKLAIYPYLGNFTGALADFIEHEDLQYDLIHSHYWLSGQVGSWAQSRWDIPHMVMFHTLGAVKDTTAVGEPEPELRITTERQLVESCHRIIAATQREKSELMQYYEGEPQKISVVPCGVNMDLFQPLQSPDISKKLGFGDHQKTILFVGRFDALKGIDRLLKAMTHLRNHRGLKLVIIGGDGQNAPEFKKFERLALKLGITDNISFIGRVEQDELPQYYSAADLLAVPSYHESFGLVALEALACGTPVVATEVGAMDRIIHKGKTGCVVADPEPEALAKAIGDFISKSPTEVESAGTIRESVRKYSWSNVADAMIDQYRSLLDQYKFSTQISFFSNHSNVADSLNPIDM